MNAMVMLIFRHVSGLALTTVMDSSSKFKDYIAGLLNDCDIFCLQEHWLTSKQLSDLSCIHYGFVYAAVSGFDDSEVLAGRPYGGCAIFWRANVNMHSDIHCVSEKTSPFLLLR